MCRERTEIINAHSRQKKDMNDMIAAMENEFLEAENELRQEFESQREEIKNRNSEEYNVLKIQLEGIIEELERHFEQAHKAYLESTEHRTQAFKQLTKNDASSARKIEVSMKKLLKLQEALQHWRTKIATNSREWEERNKSLRNEKEIMTRHYSGLKTSMDQFRAVQGERLKQLSLASNECMTKLKKKLGAGENMLKLADHCRKLETEQEKVLPFFNVGQDQLSEEDLLAQEELKAAAQELAGEASVSASDGKVKMFSYGVDDDGKPVEEWDYLNRFFKRFNKALLDKTSIEKERTRLEKENADLRSILKQYLDGISVNDDVMNNPINPLMVVNNRLQVTLAERNKARQQVLGQQARPQQQLVHVNAANGGAS